MDAASPSPVWVPLTAAELAPHPLGMEGVSGAELPGVLGVLPSAPGRGDFAEPFRVGGAWPERGHPMNPQHLPVGLPHTQSPRGSRGGCAPCWVLPGGIGLHKNRVPALSVCPEGIPAGVSGAVGAL